MDKSTENLEEVFKPKSEDLTPQIATENTQLQPAVQNTRDDTHAGIKYDTSLENILSNMKNRSIFFQIVEKENGDIF